MINVNFRMIWISVQVCTAVFFWKQAMAFADTVSSLDTDKETNIYVSCPDCGADSNYINAMGAGSGKTGSLNWICATSHAEWEPRQYHTALAFDGRLWVMGGYIDADPFPIATSDVWYSLDGTNWELATDDAAWSGRLGHASVVFDNRMWVLGGWENYSTKERLNDVWYSYDGMDWVQATANAGWGERMWFSGLVYDNKIWIIGGNYTYTKYHHYSDVWYSSDGVTWTQATDTAAWGALSDFSTVVFEDQMWVLGGYLDYITGTCWTSVDGVSWSRSYCPPQSFHTSEVFADTIWLIAGNVAGEYTNDCYYRSPELGAWVQDTPPWSERTRHASVVFDNKMWVLGGLAGPRPSGPVEPANDVWYAKTVYASFRVFPYVGPSPLTGQCSDWSTSFDEPIISWHWDFGDGTTSDEQAPAHTYTIPGAYTVSLTVASASDEDTMTKTNYVIVKKDTPHEFHSADTDQSGTIDLSELLRIIQFYNLGGLHCAASGQTTEDGYAPLPGDETCEYHDLDYAPPDWTIELGEVLRLVQFFNAGGYYACPSAVPPAEDGFCPGSLKGEV